MPWTSNLHVGFRGIRRMISPSLFLGFQLLLRDTLPGTTEIQANGAESCLNPEEKQTTGYTNLQTAFRTINYQEWARKKQSISIWADLSQLSGPASHCLDVIKIHFTQYVYPHPSPLPRQLIRQLKWVSAYKWQSSVLRTFQNQLVLSYNNENYSKPGSRGLSLPESNEQWCIFCNYFCSKSSH